METHTEGGAAIQGDAKAGRDVTGRDTHERQSQRAGDTYIGGQSSEYTQLLFRMLTMAGDIQALSLKLDDLPNRVGKLERTEVVVRPGPEVVIRPLKTDSINLPVRAVIGILAAALFLVVAMVIVLVAMRVGYV